MSNNRRIVIGNVMVLAALVFLVIGLWNEYSWYEALSPLGTLVCAVVLTVSCICYVDIRGALKDPVFWMMMVTDAIALINLFLVNSHYGAFLTVFDMLMILYLACRFRMDRKTIFAVSIFMGFFFFYWTIDVKGYFKGYNTNYGGMVLITGFVFFFIAFEMFRDYLRKRGHIKLAKWLVAWNVFMFAWGYNIISWYRARCALLGLIVFLVLILVPVTLWQKNWFYTLVVAGTTVGSVLISILYILLGNIRDKFSVQIFYKDILSGREEVWKELWSAFLKTPITGIGSAYKIKLEWMEGVFEVHNGLLDILIVHGVVVFIALTMLLIKRLFDVRENALLCSSGRVALSGIFALLTISFMENCFIVPPFSLCLLLLFSVANKADV